MLSEIGVAKTAVADDGKVFVHGEWWNARADEKIEEGRKVRVVAIEDMHLRVEPVRQERN